MLPVISVVSKRSKAIFDFILIHSVADEVSLIDKVSFELNFSDDESEKIAKLVKT